jgi:hypothetical protein
MVTFRSAKECSPFYSPSNTHFAHDTYNTPNALIVPVLSANRFMSSPIN